MDVVNTEQTKIVEEDGNVVVMALKWVPGNIRSQGGVAWMTDPGLIKEIKRDLTILIMTKARTCHFVEAQIIEAICIDYINESEVPIVVDDMHHIK